MVVPAIHQPSLHLVPSTMTDILHINQGTKVSMMLQVLACCVLCCAAPHPTHGACMVSECMARCAEGFPPLKNENFFRRKPPKNDSTSIICELRSWQFSTRAGRGRIGSVADLQS